jgi:hypothetical protein
MVAKLPLAVNPRRLPILAAGYSPGTIAGIFLLAYRGRSMRVVTYAAATTGLVVAVLASGAPAALASPAGVPGQAVSIFPNPSAPGTSTTFQINCGLQGSTSPASSATLAGTQLGLADQIPMQSTGQTNIFITTVVLPTTIAPGTYNPEVSCSNGASGSTTLQVNAVPSPAPQTGDGTTSTATNSTLTDAGLGLLGVGAVLGGVMLRRRRSRSRT